MHMPSGISSDAILKRLAPQRWPLQPHRLPNGTALVGGAIRDALLGRMRDQPDLDLVVPGDALIRTRELARELGGTCVVLDAERDMARLVLGAWTIDLARQEGSTLTEDLQRRDYRINAMALPLNPPGDLLDPTGGCRDLEAGLLTAVRERNLIDDPLRLLRGLRLMAEIPLTLEDRTASWIHCHRGRLADAAPERILAELQRLVAGPHADAALDCLQRLKLLDPWNDASCSAPPVPDPKAAAEMTVVERQTALSLARLTALIGDPGLEQLRASRLLRQRCRNLRRWSIHLKDQSDEISTLSEQNRLQLHRDLEADLPALILQLPHQLRGSWLERWRDQDDPLFHPAAPLDGTVLQQELGITPGPELGRLLEHLRHERAFGRIAGRTAALEEANRWQSHQGGAL